MRSGAMPRARATRGTCHIAAAGETCGSRPLAEAVTSSTGTGPPPPDWPRAVGRRRRRFGRAACATSDPSCCRPRPWHRSRLARRRRPRPEVGRAGEALPDQLGAEHAPVAPENQAAARLRGEEHLGHAGDGERVQDSRQQQRHHRRAQRDHSGLPHGNSYTMPTAVSSMSTSLMPTNGATTPPTP